MQREGLVLPKLRDLKLASRRFIERYPFPLLSEPPLVVPKKALGEARLLLVTTAGLHVKTDQGFSDDFNASDCSYRAIPKWARMENLSISHTSADFDRSGITCDLNVVFPVDRIEEMVGSGELGSIADYHYSFMGSLPRTGRLRKETAPAMAELSLAEGVDIAILTPV